MKATDLIVAGSAILGALVVLAGIAQFDPRVRERFGRAEATASRTTALAAGLVLGGALIVFIAIGGFE